MRIDLAAAMRIEQDVLIRSQSRSLLRVSRYQRPSAIATSSCAAAKPPTMFTLSSFMSTGSTFKSIGTSQSMVLRLAYAAPLPHLENDFQLDWRASASQLCANGPRPFRLAAIFCLGCGHGSPISHLQASE